jgi:hypothetical protein
MEQGVTLTRARLKAPNAGAVAPPDQRVSFLGSAGLPAVGAPDQRTYTLSEP